MPVSTRWTFGLAIGVLLTVVPLVHFRAVYAHNKRLREVTPGRVYRSGQMTADGFRAAIEQNHIRTVFNLQNEYADPDINQHFLGFGVVEESELCRQCGVRYVFLPPDLIPRRRVPRERPAAIDQFLEIMDDPANYPVLIHCRAGLNRTGCLVGVYRMEYEGWSPREVIREMKENGFGEYTCTAANDYIVQYVLTYQPGVRNGKKP